MYWNRLTSYLIFFTMLHLENRAWGCKGYQCPNGLTYPIHLTFDDGPHLNNTPKVLKILKKHNIKATFFVLAEEVAKNKGKQQILNQIKSAKHQIGSHSFQHLYHSTLNDKDLSSQILKSKKILSPWLTTPLLFRLPYGDGWPGSYTRNKKRSKTIMEQIRHSGFIHVGWSILPMDWDKKTKKKPGILKILSKQICENKGGVIVLHDIQDNTANNLSEWIDTLKCVGHRFTPLLDFSSENYIEPHFKANTSNGR